MIFRIILTVISLLILNPTEASAQRRPRRLPEPKTESINPFVDSIFQADKWVNQKTTLSYRFFTTDSEQQSKKMLIIYLHGRRACGTDNQQQLISGGIKSLLRYINEKHLNVMVIAPQCPVNRNWNEPISDGTQMTAIVKSLIDNLVSSGKCDSSQIYIFGDSMGGSGIWRMLNDYPTLFAAAMPIASVPRVVEAENISQTPICVVAGDRDKMANKKKINPFINELNQIDAQVRYDIMEKADHRQVCEDGYTSERIEWVLNHKRL